MGISDLGKFDTYYNKVITSSKEFKLSLSLEMHKLYVSGMRHVMSSTPVILILMYYRSVCCSYQINALRPHNLYHSLSICPSLYICLYLCLCLSVPLSVPLSISVSVSAFVCVSVCVSACLSFSLDFFPVKVQH